jgi:hypothetical protein
VAQAAGAIMRREYRQGKENVVCRMFDDIDADVYVMVDGNAPIRFQAHRRRFANAKTIV